MMYFHLGSMNSMKVAFECSHVHLVFAWKREQRLASKSSQTSLTRKSEPQLFSILHPVISSMGLERKREELISLPLGKFPVPVAHLEICGDISGQC